MSDNRDCPVCGCTMHWKYLEKPKCPKCDDLIADVTETVCSKVSKEQKRFDVFAYYADLCGNVDYNHVGCYYADSIEQVQAVFPKGFLCGFEVRQHIDDIKKLPTEIQTVPKEKR